MISVKCVTCKKDCLSYVERVVKGTRTGPFCEACGSWPKYSLKDNEVHLTHPADEIAKLRTELAELREERQKDLLDSISAEDQLMDSHEKAYKRIKDLEKEVSDWKGSWREAYFATGAEGLREENRLLQEKVTRMIHSELRGNDIVSRMITAQDQLRKEHEDVVKKLRQTEYDAAKSEQASQILRELLDKSERKVAAVQEQLEKAEKEPARLRAVIAKETSEAQSILEEVGMPLDVKPTTESVSEDDDEPGQELKDLFSTAKKISHLN